MGFTDEDTRCIEFFQLGAATGNSIAMLMWLTTHTFGNLDTVERMRVELLSVLKKLRLLMRMAGGKGLRGVRLNMALVEERCHFLLARATYFLVF